ncbi:glycerol-3-phosphate 1-O-acyltransferase PlsY [Cytophaga aurantiaca]|uniref:glycerol-3-phosphate 1-O-acyltransferase PlsY n=1 Tax=Cytophaga aurantiaca TaxID=29530 RepID=UPI00036F10C0|nr:glycerol-3-phosphate 1-O-acyltransferase PlsY [Cytophaga aurantiaca]
MINILYIIFGAFIAYLMGSFITAIWYGKQYHNIDIRTAGSGNAGATNTFRVLGKKAGTIVMLIDIFKGWAATSLAVFLVHFSIIESIQLDVYKLIYGLAAVMGHIFPIFERFKGGKGIATLLGMVLSIQLEAALICLAVFLVVLITTKYVSIGSILSTLAFPLMIIFVPKFHTETPIVIVFGFAIFLMVVLTHKKNIKRLFLGEENKTYLIKKRSH